MRSLDDTTRPSPEGRRGGSVGKIGRPVKLYIKHILAFNIGFCIVLFLFMNKRQEEFKRLYLFHERQVLHARGLALRGTVPPEVCKNHEDIHYKLYQYYKYRYEHPCSLSGPD